MSMLRDCIIEVVWRLSLPSNEQIRYIKENGFHHDELGLEFDDTFPALPPPDKSPDFTEAEYAALQSIDRKLLSMSGASNAPLWTDEGLNDAPEWADIRRMAREALTLLQRSRDLPLVNTGT